jgi:uncharacterized membrane-anchored protein YjiN (DUF445 family)
MSILFVFTHIWTPPGELWGDVWGYVRAFAEASMVGGLADWFAVSAIFRRPLGLPIPHTAVIPRNQPRIADAVGRFIADNFLKPDLVAERVKDTDLSEGLGKWLADPGQSGAVASELVIAIPTLLDTLDDDTVANFLRSQAADAAQGTQVAPAFGSVLEALAEQGRHQALLDTGLKEGFRLLQEYQGLIRVKVRERSGWLARLAGVDQRASESIVRALEDLIYDVANDSHHPIRERINDIVSAQRPQRPHPRPAGGPRRAARRGRGKAGLGNHPRLGYTNNRLQTGDQCRPGPAVHPPQWNCNRGYGGPSAAHRIASAGLA